ncbi:hypothetical protein HK101_007404 [Irineochytrium annulatum]|nr:hypothetical protein HK101_007404 [Irineochytrium annulatum]
MPSTPSAPATPSAPVPSPLAQPSMRAPASRQPAASVASNTTVLPSASRVSSSSPIATTSTAAAATPLGTPIPSAQIIARTPSPGIGPGYLVNGVINGSGAPVQAPARNVSFRQPSQPGTPVGGQAAEQFLGQRISQQGGVYQDPRFYFHYPQPVPRSLSVTSDEASFIAPYPNDPSNPPGPMPGGPNMAPFLRMVMSKDPSNNGASSDNEDSFMNEEGVIGSTPMPGAEEEDETPDINDIMADLSLKFGFQDGIILNVTEFLMAQIASRSARMRCTSTQAIVSLHNDYISGRFANYRAWALSDPVRDPEEDFEGGALAGNSGEDARAEEERRKTTDKDGYNITMTLNRSSGRAQRIGKMAEREWRRRYRRMNVWDKTHQLALYLCLMDEAANVRLMPELLCFLFRLADDYCESGLPEGVRLAAKGAYLNEIVRPIYDFHKGQMYELNGTRKETDHGKIVGYDDINETFWERRSMERIVLKDGSRLMHVPEGKRWEKLKDVDWAKSFRKTFFEKRTFASHLLVNFSRIWALLFGTYTMFLMSIVAEPMWKYRNGNPPLTDTLQLVTPDPVPETFRYTLISAGGAVAVLISIFATISEWFHIPHTAHNFRILSRRGIFHLSTFIFCVAPAVHLFVFDHQGFPAKALTAVSFVINVAAVIAHSLVPPAIMDRRKINNQVFVAKFSGMERKQRGISWGVWGCLLICKFVESWLVIFVPVQKAVETVYGLDLATCTTGFAWCATLKWLTFTVMVILFGFFYFLDTYVWWLVWTSIIQFALSSFRVFKLLTWDKLLPDLPEKLHPRLFATRSLPPNQNPRSLYARTWNAIIDDLKSTHHLSVDQVEKLRFGEVTSPLGMSGTGSQSSSLQPSQRGTTPSEALTRADSFTQLHQTVPQSPSPLPGARAPSVASSHDGSSSATPNPHASYNPYALWQQQMHRGANLFGGEQTFFTDPPHLVALRNGATKIKVFEGTQNEAERRLKFLAHTLDMEFPEPGSVRSMPGFSVLIPHYKEKVILSWEEITARDRNSAHSLLRYLQLLHPEEWKNFVEECMEELQDEEDPQGKSFTSAISNLDNQPDPANPQSFPPSLVLKTRIWCSNRSQTLYRTIAGFQKYRDALCLLHSLECEEELSRFSPENREREVRRLVDAKFRVVVSAQMYSEMSEGEREDIKICLETWRGLNIVYPEKVASLTGERVFSHLIDGYCERDAAGGFIPRITVELPGWPILGDGKGCNQNHGVFFTRGEFVETIDANQDHYFEECLKVRSILNEFNRDPRSPPVALVGLRENIFTHGVGAVADMSATTETTLVSLNQPILNKLGARMHYGHPDFWNLPYALSRGGVSKAQRGLHLNEDIFAGMMVFMRGGVNKHAEYMQVGKGKDLGVNSVMGYFSKLAMGMSEQVMSREQHRIGTALPFDRLMTFFFANPGYVLSNVMAMASLQTFVLLLVCLGALASNLTPCPNWDILGDGITFNQTQVKNYPAPKHCVQMNPIYDWERIIVLTFIPVFFIILVPVLTHTAFESGTNSILRYLRQLGSLSLVFSILSTQTWARSFLGTTTYGQARHVQTGRSIEVVRKPFHFLLTNYHDIALAMGLLLIGGLLYASTAGRGATYGLIFFWASVPPLVVAPFFYNPHQFRFGDFMEDYARTLRWFGSGVRRGDDNKEGSWIDWRRSVRAQITGHRRSPPGEKKRKNKGTHQRRATRSVIWLRELVFPTVVAAAGIVIYTVGSGSNNGRLKVAEVLVGAIAPLVLNFVFLLALEVATVLIGPCLGGLTTDGVAPVTVIIARVFSLLVFFALPLAGAWVVSVWQLSVALLYLMSVWITHRALARWIYATLPREMDTEDANLAWWDGRWHRLGVRALYVPFRELICKTVEMVEWPMDLFLTHIIMFILFPATLIKYVDDGHSMLIMWVITKFEEPALSRDELRRRRRRIAFSTVLFMFWLLVFLAFIIVPSVVKLPNLTTRFGMTL